MDNKLHFNELLKDSHLVPTSEWVVSLRAKYPYFATPAIIYCLRQKSDAEERENLLSHIALNSANRVAVSEILGEDAEKFKSFYPEPASAAPMDTNTTIDNFLSRYGAGDNTEIAALEHCIFNPVGEFSITDELVDIDENTPKDEQDKIIDSFLSKGPISLPVEIPEPPAIPTTTIQKEEETPQLPPPLPTHAISTPEPPAITPIIEESLSESLAKVYIKQKKYTKAYDMLEAVAKEHPERNLHINDQLRFLRKLIKLTQPQQ